MGETLTALEDQRNQLLQQIAGLGDFRPGSITVTTGRCGKPNCHCARPRDAGHGPNFRLTRKVDGTTVTETFPSQAANLFVHLDQSAAEVEELVKLGDLALGLVEGRWAGKGLGHRRAIDLAGETEIGPVARVAGPSAMTIGLATTPGGDGNRAGSKIAQASDLLQQLGSLVLQGSERFPHETTSYS